MKAYIFTSKRRVGDVISYVHSVFEKHEIDVVQNPEEADFIASVGGDGTFFRACQRGKPVLAIKSGKIAHSCTIDIDDVEWATEKIIAGEYSLLKLPKIGIDGESAVNDVVFRSAGSSVINYKIDLGTRVIRGRGDGLIFATPLGSSGYNLSVGGPVLDLGLGGNAWVISFIAPITRLVPLVLRAGTIKVSVEGNFGLYIDGMKVKPKKVVELKYPVDYCETISFGEELSEKHLKAVFGAL